MNRRLTLSILLGAIVFFAATPSHADLSLSRRLVSNDPAVRQNALESLFEIDLSSVPALVLSLRQTVEHEDREKRFFVLDALNRLGPEGVDLMVAMMDYPDPELRVKILEGLGDKGLGGQAAVPDVIHFTKDPNIQIRNRAIMALGKIGAPTDVVLSELVELTRSLDVDVQTHAVDAMGKMGLAAVPALGRLIDLLKESDYAVVWRSARVIGRFGHEGAPAANELVSLLDRPENAVQHQAELALLAIGDEAVPALWKGTKQNHFRLSRRSEEILRKMNGPHARAAIAKLEERNN